VLEEKLVKEDGEAKLIKEDPISMRQSSLNTSAEFPFYFKFKCEIHEARNSIYRRECLREQDRWVWVSFVRNLLESISKWKASQASLHLIKTRLKTLILGALS